MPPRHLVKSSHGSGSVDRQYTYDRWGNCTSVYDKVSGGSLIQSVTLLQFPGIPAKPIAAVCADSPILTIFP